MTTRRGFRPLQSRTFSVGLSYHAVPDATRTASSSALHLWTSCLEYSSLIHFESLFFRAMNPSDVSAHLRMIRGLFFSMYVKNRLLSSYPGADKTSATTVTPACRNFLMPFPPTSGLLSWFAITTVGMP